LEFQQGRENSIFSLAYLELYAPALGLGSCWAGIFELCAFSGHEPLLKLFNIPEGKKITGAVMVGYPQYRYQRLTDRNPLEVAFL
jgi:nitroreductase